METLEKQKLTDLLIRVKKVHKVYGEATEEQRGRLLEAIGPTLDELTQFGYEKDFLIGLVIGGKDFLESLGPVEGLDSAQSTELIFR